VKAGGSLVLAADAGAAARRAVGEARASLGALPPSFAVLFTCTGRGTRMFAQPDHDTGLLAEALGQIPVAGFFCDRELGPVGGQNFLHTFSRKPSSRKPSSRK
jgi:small ligand-binding sensory domain FIST